MQVNSIVGSVNMDPVSVESETKLRSISDLTDMQMKAMDMLWRIAAHAIHAPAHQGSPRSTIPTQYVVDAQKLVNKYKEEAKRWTEEPKDEANMRVT